MVMLVFAPEYVEIQAEHIKCGHAATRYSWQTGLYCEEAATRISSLLKILQKAGSLKWQGMRSEGCMVMEGTSSNHPSHSYITVDGVNDSAGPEEEQGFEESMVNRWNMEPCIQGRLRLRILKLQAQHHVPYLRHGE